jgi:hypothetical protein
MTQKYAAQKSRCVLFFHKWRTMELNKCSGQFSSSLCAEPMEPESINYRVRWGETAQNFPVAGRFQGQSRPVRVHCNVGFDPKRTSTSSQIPSHCGHQRDDE